MKAHGMELRERILEDCANGLSERKAAEKWKVGRSTIAKIKKQRRPVFVALAAPSNPNKEKPVFMDETGAKSNMTRRYGRALRGVRLVDHTPHGHWVNSCYVCAIRKGGISAPAVFEGAMNKARFDEYVRDVLCPTLQKGDIVVWDNLPAHRMLLPENWSKRRERP